MFVNHTAYSAVLLLQFNTQQDLSAVDLVLYTLSCTFRRLQVRYLLM